MENYIQRVSERSGVISMGLKTRRLDESSLMKFFWRRHCADALNLRKELASFQVAT